MQQRAQVIAYANADFEAAHSAIVRHFQRVFPHLQALRTVADLGCGAADITIRFARLYPDCNIDAVDGAAAMLQQARLTIQRASLQRRITLHLHRLPHCQLPNKNYDAIISNSLLHHLHNPQHLWSTVRRYATAATAIFIADLCRPTSRQVAADLVKRYASDEPDVLRRDFYNSLLASFNPAEVHTQLNVAGLNGLRVEQISDRHMLIYGHL